MSFNGQFVPMIYTICPRSSDPFYIVTYYIKGVTTSWAYSIYLDPARVQKSKKS